MEHALQEKLYVKTKLCNKNRIKPSTCSHSLVTPWSVAPHFDNATSYRKCLNSHIKTLSATLFFSSKAPVASHSLQVKHVRLGAI